MNSKYAIIDLLNSLIRLKVRLFWYFLQMIFIICFKFLKKLTIFFCKCFKLFYFFWKITSHLEVYQVNSHFSRLNNELTFLFFFHILFFFGKIYSKIWYYYFCLFKMNKIFPTTVIRRGLKSLDVITDLQTGFNW
jgi:hypothetical protein